MSVAVWCIYDVKVDTAFRECSNCIGLTSDQTASCLTCLIRYQISSILKRLINVYLRERRLAVHIGQQNLSNQGLWIWFSWAILSELFSTTKFNFRTTQAKKINRFLPILPIVHVLGIFLSYSQRLESALPIIGRIGWNLIFSTWVIRKQIIGETNSSEEEISSSRKNQRRKLHCVVKQRNQTKLE